jgi:hypothetical protein
MLNLVVQALRSRTNNHPKELLLVIKRKGNSRMCISRALISVLILSSLIACGGEPTAEPTATIDQAAVAEEMSSAQTQEALSAQETEARSNEVTEAALATNEEATRVQATSDAVEREATREAAIEEAKLAATAEAKQFFTRVRELYEQGYLSRTDGTYFTIPDFDENWAQINWYQWYYTGYSPADFIIRADAAWESASDKANWWNSGCGFVFRVSPDGDHYMAYLALDGDVRFQRLVNEVSAYLGDSYYGKLNIPAGEAEIMLVVEGDIITFFVNGEKVHTRRDTALPSGDLALTLVSGTNLDFGTRCQMTDIELWELD